MEDNWFSRTALLVGNDKMNVLQQAHVMVVGLGGVGGITAEMLCRAGIGELTIIDADVVSATNINRQIVALSNNVGTSKSAEWFKRLLSINPQLKLHVYDEFVEENSIARYFKDIKIDFVADAIDTIAPKVALIEYCLNNKIRIISSMGSGAKRDVSKICVTDISKTFNCRLARTIRQRLAKDGFKHGLPVVFSSELPDVKAIVAVDERNKKSTTGTISFLPTTFGCFMSAYIINTLMDD